MPELLLGSSQWDQHIVMAVACFPGEKDKAMRDAWQTISLINYYRQTRERLLAPVARESLELANALEGSPADKRARETAANLRAADLSETELDTLTKDLRYIHTKLPRPPFSREELMEMLECLCDLEAIPAKFFQTQWTNRRKQGELAGRTLLVWLNIAKNQNEIFLRLSQRGFRKAMKEDHWRELEASEGWNLSASESAYEKAWADFQSVAHFHLAFFLRGRELNIDCARALVSVDLEGVLATAEWLRLHAEALRVPQQETWTVPPERVDVADLKLRFPMIKLLTTELAKHTGDTLIPERLTSEQEHQLRVSPEKFLQTQLGD